MRDPRSVKVTWRGRLNDARRILIEGYSFRSWFFDHEWRKVWDR